MNIGIVECRSLLVAAAHVTGFHHTLQPPNLRLRLYAPRSAGQIHIFLPELPRTLKITIMNLDLLQLCEGLWENARDSVRHAFDHFSELRRAPRDTVHDI